MNIPTRRKVIGRVKKEGGRIAAVLPVHYPRALLRAFGIQPLEVWGPPHVDDMAGTAHFPEYTCKIVTKATRFLQSDAAADVDLILLPHTCDSLQGMASVMGDHMDMGRPVLTLYHPRGRRASDAAFLRSELARLFQDLEKITGRCPDRRDLTEAMETENRAQARCCEMASNRSRYPVSDRDFFTLLRSREYLPAEDFIALADSLSPDPVNLPGPGLLLSGIVPEPMDLFDFINDCGAHVIADDLACVSRRCYAPATGSDPLTALAEQLLSMPADSTVSTPYKQRFKHLIATARCHGAKGVLVYNPKFCEPELFYIPMLEKAVKAEGLGFLHVEVELDTEIPHTVQNRIDAFIEVLS